MQIWIFFAGSSGDGFANLLEHATNARTIDNQKLWRINKYVDYQARFWSPAPDRDQCFRYSQRFNCATNQLLPKYLEALQDDQHHTIVTSNDLNQTHLRDSDNLEILTQNQIKVLLSLRQPHVARQTVLKNLADTGIKQAERKLDPEDIFDHIVYIEDLQQSWDLTKKFTTELGLTLEQDMFNHYTEIISGKLFYTTPGIKYYNSVKTETGVDFHQIDEINLDFKGVPTVTH